MVSTIEKVSEVEWSGVGACVCASTKTCCSLPLLVGQCDSGTGRVDM